MSLLGEYNPDSHTYEPELRMEMGAVSLLSFADLDSGDQVVVEIEPGRNAENRVSTVYTIEVKEKTTDGIFASWIESRPSPMGSDLVKENVSGEEDLETLEDEFDNESSSIYEWDGTVIGSMIIAMTHKGSVASAAANGLLRASTLDLQCRLLFKEAFSLQTLRLEAEGESYWSLSIRSIYVIKNSISSHRVPLAVEAI